MYAYVTCCPDIGYTVTTHSKFSMFPTKYHYYTCLYGGVQYLSSTKKQGIRHHQTCLQAVFHHNLVPGNFMDQPLPLPDNNPNFPETNPI